MENEKYIKELKDHLSLLETQVKHLKNDLRLTKEEYETATSNYFEIYNNLETKVAERTNNINELKKRLEQKAEQLETMIDSSLGIILFKDIDQNLIRANRNFIEIAGLPSKDVIGKNFNDLLPGYNKKYLKNDQKVIQSGTPILGLKETIISGNIERKCIVDRIPYKDIDGNVAGIICFIHDITELEKSRDEKKNLEAQLHHAQRIESIGTLAGGTAHNFNNLLMGILGNVSLMLMETDEKHSFYKNLKTIEKLVKNGSELTSKLLGFARNGSYEIKPVDLNLLVKETARTFADTKKEIRVNYDFSAKPLGVLADQSQIEEVLLNLFVNAADALPFGGDLFLSTSNITDKDLKGKPYKPSPGNYILLSVRDNGVGIDKNTMERIFEPFFTTKGLAKGTGLGLASAYGIIKAHGGYIDVESQKGEGTTFNIYLPATNKKVETHAESNGDIIPGKGTILLVDDEDFIIELGNKMLNSLGYKVISSWNGKQALEVYKKNKDIIDMVLLDMVMPDMGGGETFDRLKEIDPTVKVLLSSGYSLDGQAQQILDRGCSGFIQKPFSLKGLSQKIQPLIEQSGPVSIK